MLRITLKRTLALVLALVLMCGAFGSCAVIKGDVVMRYGDYTITETMYSYWMSKYKTLFLYMYNNSKDTLSFWNTEIEEGNTYEDFIVGYIQNYAKQVLLSMYLFDEYSMSLTDDQKDGVEDYINDLIEAYGGKNVLNETLAEMGLNIETLKTIYYAEEKLATVTDAFFGENGIMAVNDNDREQYYLDNYYCAEWIYVYTSVKLKKDDEGRYYTDENGVYLFDDLTEEEKAIQLAKVEEIEAKLEAGENFESVRAEYSEENLDYYSVYPDGIFLSANDYENYGLDMLTAIQGTECGEYTKFDNGYATVIVKRLELKGYSSLTSDELSLMVNFEDYVLANKTEIYFNGYEVEMIDDVLGRYDIKTIAGAKDTSI